MNVKNIADILAEMAILKYFPADKHARAALVALVCSMATTEDQVRWLVRRTLALFNEWPGPQELRAVFCSKFRPRDGINAYSQIYLDGVPSEKPQEYLGIEGAAQNALKLLSAGSDDPEMASAVQKLSKAATMPKGLRTRDRFARELRQAITAPRDRPEKPAPTPQIITQADIDAEFARQRAAKRQPVAAGDSD